MEPVDGDVLSTAVDQKISRRVVVVVMSDISPCQIVSLANLSRRGGPLWKSDLKELYARVMTFSTRLNDL